MRRTALLPIAAISLLLALTALISGLTITPGRATRLQGGVRLAVFAGFLVLAFSP